MRFVRDPQLGQAPSRSRTRSRRRETSAVPPAPRRQGRRSAPGQKTLHLAPQLSVNDFIRHLRHSAARVSHRSDGGAAHMRMLRSAHLYRMMPEFGAGRGCPRPGAVERRHRLHFRHPHRFLPLTGPLASRRSQRSRRANSISVRIAKSATRTAPSRTKGNLFGDEAVEDRRAERQRADRRTDRRRADGDRHRDADAGKDHRGGERQLDVAQLLPGRKAEPRRPLRAPRAAPLRGRRRHSRRSASKP